jgi:hypothetical protein
MREKRNIRVLVILAAFMLVLGFAQTSYAVLAAVSPNTNPNNGFPVWYEDEDGTMLQQCNFMLVPPEPGQNTDPNCIPGAGNEAFWWAGDTTIINAAQGVDATLLMGVEAAFFTGPNNDGDQITFGRIRIRADLPLPGTYTVTHPFGTRNFVVTAVTNGDEINFTQDIGGGRLNFLPALGTAIGPFLSCVDPAPPAGYLGNYRRRCTVTGSPNGTNFFRITGPSVNVTQQRFNVSGKLFTPFRISGIVRNQAGTPVQGVTVDLTGDATATATTNATGRYTFTQLANGDYTVTPSQAGSAFTPIRRLVTIDGANVTGQNFRVSPVAAGFTISGFVKNAAGVGLPGVTIDLIGTATGSTTTNANGRYAFTGMADGTYTVTPTLTGSTFTPASRTVIVSGANRPVGLFTSN